jgi:hypothetical protein
MSHELTRFSERREAALLWFGFLGPFAAWKVQLMVNYVLVPYACWRDLGFLIDLASLAAFALALLAGWVAWGAWKRSTDAREAIAGEPTGSMVETEISRARFMSMSGMGFGAFAALLILAQWLPGLVLSPCWS